MPAIPTLPAAIRPMASGGIFLAEIVAGGSLLSSGVVTAGDSVSSIGSVVPGFGVGLVSVG